VQELSRIALRLIRATRLGNTKARFEAQYGEYPSLQRIERVVTQQRQRATGI